MIAIVLDRRGPMVDHDDVTLKIQAGSFKFGQGPMAPLEEGDQTADDGSFGWAPKVPLSSRWGTRWSSST